MARVSARARSHAIETAARHLAAHVPTAAPEDRAGAVRARLGREPAFRSGPLATVIQDVLSLALYFATVSVLVD